MSLDVHAAGEAVASAPMLSALPAGDPPAAPERCSCDEALSLRAQLAFATRGSIAIHVVKEDGYWTIERYRDGELRESYVGVASIAEALERIGDWMRGGGDVPEKR